MACISDFVHLHVHSHYSLLDASNTISKLLKKVAELGMPAVALTDHGNLFGAMEFYLEAKKYSVQPILGCEFYVSPMDHKVKAKPKGFSGKRYHHLIILAQSNQGYKNLVRLASVAYTEGFYYRPRIDKKTLALHSEGLICLSACLGGEVPQTVLGQGAEKARFVVEEFQEIFGKDRFFLELQDHGIPEQAQVNRCLLDLAKECDAPLVATNDVHYLNPGDDQSHDVLLCIGTQKKHTDSKRKRYHGDQFFLKSAQQMQEVFKEYPQEVLSNSVHIANMCTLELDFQPSMPKFQVPKGYTSNSFLVELCCKGAQERYSVVSSKIQERLDYELQMITKMGFSDYFLIVWDFIQWAKKNQIATGPGRGSVAGSLIAYVLSITQIDPLRYQLIFERFLNPERISMPDIDTDFEDVKRDQVIQYVIERYGQDKVANIITFGALKARAVLRDVARVLDISLPEINRIVKLVSANPGTTLKASYHSVPEFKTLIDSNPAYQKLFQISQKLEGINRHASTHAAGVVIANEPISETIPLYADPKTKVLSTQYEGVYLEQCGLLKMDFLGLRNLSVIQKALEFIRVNQKALDIHTIPLDSSEVFSLLQKGQTLGVFQLESTGIQQLMRQMKPSCFEDVIALIALFRPGPLNSGMAAQFIERKNHPKKISYPHPSLEFILKDTYGVIIYQEQVMQIAQVIGSFSMSQADELRKAMGKKLVDKMHSYKAAFLQGADRNHIERSISETLFDQMAKFGQYGFNKSHSAAYALLTYQTAYLKTWYPLEYLTALLSCDIENTDKISKYVHEAKAMGIEILAPCVNQSQVNFSMEQARNGLGRIRFGLSAIKNIGSSAMKNVVESREKRGRFTSLLDLCQKVSHKSVHKKALESLIKSGACDSVHQNRNGMCESLESVLKESQKAQHEKAVGQSDLFSGTQTPTNSSDHPPLKHTQHEAFIQQVVPWSSQESLFYEKEVLGFYLSAHPLDDYKPQIHALKLGQQTLEGLEKGQIPDGSTVQICGLVTALEWKVSKKGKAWGHATLEDIHNHSCEIVFLGSIVQKAKTCLEQSSIVVIRGKFEGSSGPIKVLAEAIQSLAKASQAPQRLDIQIEEHFNGQQDLKSLKSLLLSRPGNSRVYFQYAHKKMQAGSRFRVEVNEKLLAEIQSYPWVKKANVPSRSK